MYPNGSGHGGPQHRPDGHVRERAGRAGGVQEGDRRDHGPARRPEVQAAVAVAERGGERAAQEQDAQHEEVSAMLKNKMCMHGVFPDFAGEKKRKKEQQDPQHRSLTMTMTMTVTTRPATQINTLAYTDHVAIFCQGNSDQLRARQQDH